MQGGSRRPVMRRYARPDTEEEPAQPKVPSSDQTPSENLEEGQQAAEAKPSSAPSAANADSASSTSSSSPQATLQQLTSGAQAAAAAAIAAVGGPAVAIAAAAALALTGLGLGLGLMLRRRRTGSSGSRRSRSAAAGRAAASSNTAKAGGRKRRNSSGTEGATGNGSNSANGSEASGAAPLANGSAHAAAGAKGGKGAGKAKAPAVPQQPGPCSKLKATSNCVPLADGSACVVRRKIAADNSCLFNAVGYCMHHSHNKAPFLRNVVAREVAGDPQSYTAAFLGMSNTAYCAWIVNPLNWGGGIELSILVKHYRREIAAWNIEGSRAHTFGEDAGYPKQVMVIYNGNHYDALAISNHPRASAEDDVTEFNPRTKRGKMILAAAQKLVELNHKGAKFVSSSPKNATPALRCAEAGCGVKLASQAEVMTHAATTGHTKFEEVKS